MLVRRKAPLGTVAGQPGLRLINKYHICLRVALLLQAWLSIPPKILPAAILRLKVTAANFTA